MWLPGGLAVLMTVTFLKHLAPVVQRADNLSTG